MLDDIKKYYSLFDGLGSIVGMTDSAGNDVNRYDYDPYGTIISQQEQSGLNNPWKFAAGYLDSSTGLYKFGVRYYDPTLGRWTQLDSAGTGYVYAGDNPVNAVDPSGKISFSPIFDAWGLPGVAIKFLSVELSILASPFASIPLKILLSALVWILPSNLPEGVSNYIQEELPNSIVTAQAECSGGATIDFTAYDLFNGSSPPITCN
ncbi:MAG: RHS repeat domain-containing protein [Ktedonobacteraceae bacterium]